MRRLTLLTILPVLLAASVGGAAAQQVEVRGRGDVENDAFLRRVVAGGDYRLIISDTLIARNDTITGNALVMRATLRLDGTITGDLIIVDGNVFLRPSARVLGSVHNVAGGLYPSELAAIGGGVRSEPNAPYTVRESGGSYVILGTANPNVLVRPGLFGFAPPTYDRVDGLTLSYSTGLLLPRMERIEPQLTGRVDYRSQRGAITGGLELTVPRGGTEVAVGAERTTLTNERWISGDLDNTISFFFQGKDYRDYYEADRAYVELRRTLESGPRSTSAFLRGQVEDARSLRAGNPWTVLGTPREDNLVIDDGRITSLLAGGRLAWDHSHHVIRATGSAEAAGTTLGGDRAFAAGLLDVDWALAALADHTLRVQAHFQGPLPGTDSLPRQRWSFVGGSGTLHTFDFAEFRGDRVVFVETRYIIPFSAVRLRFLGSPDIELLHLAGMAWTADERPPLEQNVGARLRFSLVNVRFIVDPSDLGNRKLSVGLNLPRRAYPWERRAQEAREERRLRESTRR